MTGKKGTKNEQILSFVCHRIIRIPATSESILEQGDCQFERTILTHQEFLQILRKQLALAVQMQ
jgi:hypothetical protein